MTVNISQQVEEFDQHFQHHVIMATY